MFRSGLSRDIRKKMIVADMQVLLPAGSQNPGTHIPSSSRLVSWGLPASRIQQAFDLEDSPDIHPLLMVTCIIHRVGNRTKGHDHIITYLKCFVPG
ncbi:unnamed protein product [Penicillium crustosum]